MRPPESRTAFQGRTRQCQRRVLSDPGEVAADIEGARFELEEVLERIKALKSRKAELRQRLAELRK
jgi:hypothetical protein